MLCNIYIYISLRILLFYLFIQLEESIGKALLFCWRTRKYFEWLNVSRENALVEEALHRTIWIRLESLTWRNPIPDTKWMVWAVARFRGQSHRTQRRTKGAREHNKPTSNPESAPGCKGVYSRCVCHDPNGTLWAGQTATDSWVHPYEPDLYDLCTGFLNSDGAVNCWSSLLDTLL